MDTSTSPTPDATFDTPEPVEGSSSRMPRNALIAAGLATVAGLGLGGGIAWAARDHHHDNRSTSASSAPLGTTAIGSTAAGAPATLPTTAAPQPSTAPGGSTATTPAAPTGGASSADQIGGANAPPGRGPGGHGGRGARPGPTANGTANGAAAGRAPAGGSAGPSSSSHGS